MNRSILLVFLFAILVSSIFSQNGTGKDLSEVFGKEIETNKFDFSTEFSVQVIRSESTYSSFHLERKKDSEFKESDDEIQEKFLRAVDSIFQKGPLVSRSNEKMFNGSWIEWKWFENAFLKTSFDETDNRTRLDEMDLELLKNKFLKVEEVRKVANLPGIYSVTDPSGKEIWTSHEGLTFGSELFVSSKSPELPQFLDKDLSKSKCIKTEKIPKRFGTGNMLLEFGKIRTSTIKGRVWGDEHQVFGAVQLISENEVLRCTPNEEGYFDLKEIPDGEYELRLTGPAFQTHIAQLVIDRASKPVLIVIQMKVGT